jgi:hypothetical protein
LEGRDDGLPAYDPAADEPSPAVEPTADDNPFCGRPRQPAAAGPAGRRVVGRGEPAAGHDDNPAADEPFLADPADD